MAFFGLLTDQRNSYGVVGTLIAVSKLIDDFTDIFFGSMIDKKTAKWEAKPWMLYGNIGCAITLSAVLKTSQLDNNR